MEKKISLIALDMDGTLFNSRGEISQRDKETLKRAADAGVAVAVATGRCYGELPAEELALLGIRYAITGNGSAIYRMPDKHCVYRDCLDKDIVLEIVEKLKKLDIYYDVYIEGKVYCPQSAVHNIYKMDMPAQLHDFIAQSRTVVDDIAGLVRTSGAEVEKATTNFALLEDGTYLDRDAVEDILRSYPQVEYLCGGFHNWEFTKAGVTKGTGLRFLAEKLGVPMDETMACGDSGNDLPMLKTAHLAVAMDNAANEIKAAADFITLSNEESGVAHAVEKFVFKEV